MAPIDIAQKYTSISRWRPSLGSILQQDTHSLEDTYSSMRLSTRYSLGFRQTQHFLSLPIHNAASDRFFHSLKKKDKLQRAHLLSCREPKASNWLRAIPDTKFKTAVSGALWNTMISLRLLIPIDTFCSYCADAGAPVPAEKYGLHALICRHKYGYTRRHNTLKDTLAQTAFRRCGMTVIH